MNTREKIVHGAVQLFVENSVAETTTRQIAQQAQVAEGSIYRYFPSKDEMAWQIFCEYHQHLAQRLHDAIELGSAFEEQVSALVTEFLLLADQDWLMFRFYLTAQHAYMPRINEQVLSPYQVIVDVIDTAEQKGWVACEDQGLTAAMAIGVVHQVALGKVYGRIEGELSVYAERLSAVICHILRNETGESV